MVNKFEIRAGGKVVALAYVSPHPSAEGQVIASLIPITRKGKFVDDSLEIIFEGPIHDIADAGAGDRLVIEDLLGQAAIEPWKVAIVPAQ